MKVSKDYIGKLIKEALLREQSENAYARFVLNMEKLAAFSEKSLAMQRFKETKPDLYERLQTLGRKIVKKIQGDFPGTIDIDTIRSIISQAKKEKRDNPSIDYAARVVQLSNDIWFDNINRGVSRAEGNFLTADPRARGEVAKSLDRTLKYAWKQEAMQPENKRFWDNFEVWHSIGGIADRGKDFDHEKILKFLEDFKTSNPHELSAFGYSGKSGDSLNFGIQEIISKSGWKNHANVRLEGDITFAANFDITTQWLSLKDEDTSEFEKSADFNKLFRGDNFDNMITGPKDKLLGGEDTYNEIVIKDSKVTAIVMPQMFFKTLRDIGSYRFDNASLFYIGRLITDGELEEAHQELLDNLPVLGNVGFGNFYAQDTHNLVYAMISGDKADLKSPNRVIDQVNYYTRYLDYDIEIYNLGAKVTERVRKQVELLKACIGFVDNNPAHQTRKDFNWREWTQQRKPAQVKFIDKYLEYVDPEKRPDTVKFMKSKEGQDYIETALKFEKMGRYHGLDIKEFQEKLFNPKEYILGKAPPEYASKKKSAPLVLNKLITLGALITKIEGTIPPFTPLAPPKPVAPEPQLPAPPTPPPGAALPTPPQKKRISDKVIMPPYFITIQWQESPTARLQTYTDDITGKGGLRPHQDSVSIIKNMLNGIHNRGGSVEYFAIYDPEIKHFVKAANTAELDKLVIPPVDTAPPPPDPAMTGEKMVSEIKITRKQLRNIARKLL